MANEKRTRLLLKLIPYFVIWTLGGFIYLLLEFGIIGDHPIYPATQNPYEPQASILAMPAIVILFTLTIGLTEEVFFRKYLKKSSFIKRVSVKTLIYITSISFIIFTVTLVVNGLILEASIFDSLVITNQLSFLYSTSFISIVTYCSALIALNLFVSEIIDYLGLNIVGHYFTGKYATPVEEERIFMFLDMKSSTTIAEKLGNTSYFRLVNKYYEDMAEPILNARGEIYQYVGDEIVISWRLSSELKNLNCIRCFFDIQAAIEKQKKNYQETFGLVPSFKAGIHVGTVSRGQVGVTKKEMLFTGDPLNTTSRIQNLCNDLNASLLISGELKDKLPPSCETSRIGEYELKGKHQKVTIHQITNSPAL